jgi:hypothetical protein
MHVIAAHSRVATGLYEPTSQRPNLRFFQKKIECVPLNRPLPLPPNPFRHIMHTYSTLRLGREGRQHFSFASGRFRIQISIAFWLSSLRSYAGFFMRPVKCWTGATKLSEVHFQELANLFINPLTV